MKKKFFIMLSIVILIVFSALFCIAYRFNYIPHKKYTNDFFGFETYMSHTDKDHDGIDDQTDILNSVRSYIDTKPKYKSRYYATGYPDDGYGTCTDVVAFGLLGAGYDLRTLVNEDIKNNKDQYNIDIIDKNIDFRRVNNLKIYLDHTAIILTTDISKKEQWQGGDIVVFKRHIGIISNYRNKHGIPFVIHHASPRQTYYEEDILEYRNDIIGHYRIS